MNHAEKDKLIAGLEAEIEELKAAEPSEPAETDQALEEMSNQLAVRDSEIEELKNQVSARDDMIENLKEVASEGEPGELMPPLDASSQQKRLCGLIRRRFGMSGADHVEMLRLAKSVANLTE